MPTSSMAPPSFLAELSGPAGSASRLKKVVIVVAATTEDDHQSAAAASTTGTSGLPGRPRLEDILDARGKLKSKSEQRELGPRPIPVLRGLPFLRDIVARAFRLRPLLKLDADATDGGGSAQGAAAVPLGLVDDDGDRIDVVNRK